MNDAWRKLREKWARWHEENPPIGILTIRRSGDLPMGFSIEAGTNRLIIPGGRVTPFKVVVETLG